MPLSPGIALQALAGQVRLLESAWEREYPHRAKGALNALSGFRYQFLVALLETVRKWVALDAPERSQASLFTERLSDLVRVESERAVTVTQIKKTASTTQVRAALEELWTIHTLAIAETPELARVLRFRILAANGTLAAIERVRDEWIREGATEAELDEFKGRIEAVLESDPEDELLALLVNALHAGNPLSRVYSWYGKLLDAAEDGSFRSAAKAIWSDLVDLGSSDPKPPGVYLWTAQDRPPREVTKGGFLSGRQPLVKDLKEGNFAPRRQVYGELATHAEQWVGSDPAPRDQNLRVPVFWIEGRSGSGKSVALLHLLSRLHDEGYGPIVWLADKILALPDTMRWARRLQQRQRRVIIALDDPFAPGEQTDSLRAWPEAIAVIQDARDAGRPEEIPLIICCGPTEQADYLEDELSQDLSMKRHVLPRESQQEIEELRQWFLLRTGEKAPATGNENILLVQIFFEWSARKTLPAFADHFRRRLLTADSTRTTLLFVTRLLALNRIYVGHPSSAAEKALSGKQRDALNRLRRDEHIAEDSRGRRGSWLAHPHLANAIYEHWHPKSPGNREERKEHLHQAIKECLLYSNSAGDRMAPFWALLHSLVSDSQGQGTTDRLEPELVSSLLEELYAQDLTPAQMPLAELAVWIEIRGLYPDLHLAPDPGTLARDWLRRVDPENSSWAFIWQSLLSVTPGDRRLLALARVWLRNAPAAQSSWAFVWHLLWNSTPENKKLRALATGWLRKTPPSHGSWSFVWKPLWSATPGDPELVALARDWLRNAPQHGSWQYVWQPLWSATPGDQELVELAKDWLRYAPRQDRSWRYVLQPLRNERPGDPELVELAKDWLRYAPPEENS